jgi:NTP pyrophosphatase (non-canonical NTP hydrolase)
MSGILANVQAERDRQDKKWGQQDHAPAVWLAILAEEFGEAAKAVLEGKPLDYHKELIQVAAVACAAAESLERNKDKVPDLTVMQQRLAATEQRAEKPAPKEDRR